MLWLILRALLSPSGGDRVTVADVDTPVTRAEIETAIHEHRATLARMPAHWIDRRASIHHAIDNLLDQWELAEA